MHAVYTNTMSSINLLVVLFLRGRFDEYRAQKVYKKEHTATENDKWCKIINTQQGLKVHRHENTHHTVQLLNWHCQCH